MELFKVTLGLIVIASLSATLSSAHLGFNFGWGGHGGSSGWSFSLFPEFYQVSCPQANDIVMSVLERAIAYEPRIAASLLRVHFHDCFVQGCDTSVLLDDSATIVSEKNSMPNKNSLRGFEVIDEIKAKLEEVCPQTVSCADILALVARGSIVFIHGGENRELVLTASPEPSWLISEVLEETRSRATEPLSTLSAPGAMLAVDNTVC
nr:peroxidase 9 [Quercus suber]POE81721.1 peroxidase 9 [Quercus suber]